MRKADEGRPYWSSEATVCLPGGKMLLALVVRARGVNTLLTMHRAAQSSSWVPMGPT